jgi:hypothetical protein
MGCEINKQLHDLKIAGCVSPKIFNLQFSIFNPIGIRLIINLNPPAVQTS